jgi:DNA-binding NarL/FixJ family response regulator
VETAPAAGVSRQRWRDVVSRLAREPELSADELALLAEASWWLCDIPEATRLLELLHERHLVEGRPVNAAHAGLRVSLVWGTRGNGALAKAWLERASRLLVDQPTCVVHGYAEYLRGVIDLDLGEDVTGVVARADRVRQLGRELGDRTLECFALTLGGMAAVRAGDLGGFAALEEAMIPVLGGQVDPLWGGDIFCSVIHLCEGLGDLARMRAWTDALNAWATPLSDTFLFAGVTRIHQLQLLRAEGQWDQVEQELAVRSAGLADAHGWLAGAGYYELGEIRRLRGDEQGAQAAYDLARGLGVEPQPGEALLRLARGETTQALDDLRVALAWFGPLERARLIPDTVEVALAAGDRELAEQLTDEAVQTAGRFGTPGLVAAAARATAACAMAEGRWDDAEAALERAARVHRRQRERHESARDHEALAEVYRRRGGAGRAAAAEATARAIYAALGAGADLARMAHGPRPGGLTAREVDVLVRVSAGRTNKEVARDLVISDKTVGRHLSSIFTKTGVSSRTAAAAWARQHGLT